MRLLHLIRKELIELRQDPRLFGIVVMAPIIQLTVLGYAATTDVKDVPVLVVDADRSAESQRLISRFEASANFVLAGIETATTAIPEALDHRRAWMALTIPPGFGRDVAAGRRVTLQVVADGTDANSTTVALGYARALIAGYAAERRIGSGGEAQTPPALAADIRVWFNPGLESRVFMIPGIVALLLLVVTTNLSAMAIVREKEVGTLEQLNVTPLGRGELILGKLLPYALIGMLDAALVTAVAVGWFHVPLRGSLTLLFAACPIYLLCTLALGLFISTISETQQQAMMTTTFFFLTPMIYLSGFIFPIENMPEWIQPLTVLVPLRYFLVVLRGIFLKGIGFEVLWPQLAAMLVWGLGMLSLAFARSGKRLA